MSAQLSSLLTLILAAAYSAWVYCYKQDLFWDWLNTLAATGISFFLALIAGLYLFNQQTLSTNAAQKDDLRALLGAEISDLLRILNDTSQMNLTLPGGRVIDVLITFVQPLAIEKAALSGLFGRAESENLLHIARKIRMFNLKVKYFLGLVQARADEATFVHAHTNIEETRTATIAGLLQVAASVGVVINEQYPD